MHESTRTRMSPLTALFMGLWIIGGIGITAGATVVLYGMKIIDNKSDTVLAFAENTVESLPELIESLPPVFADLLNDRRAPEYVDSIDVVVRFVADERRNGLRPVLTITNKGKEVVSLLAVRVAALNADGVPIGEWTQIAATPTAIEDQWRGVLMPHKTRHLVVSGYPRLPASKLDELTAAVEISELRVWVADRQG